MKLKAGSMVEVLRRRKDPCGSWYPVKIMSVDGDNYTVRYKSLLDNEGEPVVEMVPEEDARPHPPPVKGGERWVIGDIAEVFDIHSWRAGKVATVLNNNWYVIRLFGSIQLKEFHKSNLRIRQAWHNGKWVMLGKIGGSKQIDANLTQNCLKYSQGLSGALQHGTHSKTYTRERNGQEDLKRDGREKNKTFSTVRTLKRDRDYHIESSHNDIVMGGGGKKRNTATKLEGCGRQSIRTFPLLEQVEASSSPKTKMGRKCMNRSSAMDVKTHKKNIYSLHPSSFSVLVAEVGNECSVASCSSNNFLEYAIQNSRKSSRYIAGNSDDAGSSCPSIFPSQFLPLCAEDELEANIHKLELHAYKSTMQALYASGPLSWEQESLLTNLRLSLHISNEEHLLELRHLLSAQVL